MGGVVRSLDVEGNIPERFRSGFSKGVYTTKPTSRPYDVIFVCGTNRCKIWSTEMGYEVGPKLREIMS